MYNHILLPTDGSELSARAVESGIGLAKALGARVTGLTVIVEAPVAAGIGKALAKEDEPVRAAEGYLRALNAAATRAGVPHESFHVRAAAAHEAIVQTAEAKGCDLIVMGSHGRRGLAALVLGSETQQVLTRSRVPVLVHR